MAQDILHREGPRALHEVVAKVAENVRKAPRGRYTSRAKEAFVVHNAMSFIGAFRPSNAALGGLLWKNPWRLSSTRKSRARQRLRDVDNVIETVRASGVECHALNRNLALPKENEMHPRDKYTVFSPSGVNFRKSAHKVPKWTRKTLRVNPVGF